MHLKRTALAIGASVFATAAAAGPPYATDDPEPTDLGHWEIYAFAQGTEGRHVFDGSTGLDLNYGALPGVQLTATLPLDIVHDGSTRVGAGDLELGVKYRFFHGQRSGIDIAAFPRVILPTARRGFGTGRVAMLLPIWAQKDFGLWSLFGGAGYTINPGHGNRDFWGGGFALTRTLTPRLSLGAEVTREGPDSAGGRRTTGLGLGGIYKLGGPFALLLSGGPSFEHRRRGAAGNVYVALGMDF